MTWTVTYHHEVQDDLDNLGKAKARRILKVINDRIINGSPDKTGKPLSGNLANCRRIRSGSYRIVYKIDGEKIEVLVLAIGPRHNKEVYNLASKRK